ncbi:MAG: response regulator [Candidatus Hydrogenedentes bacterium]|nr:response regulator [Candidatus Hydrogenedentota bacterium]
MAKRPLTVLAIDADSAFLDQLTRHLQACRSWQVQFLAATAPEEGFALLSRNDADVLFLDHLSKALLRQAREAGFARPVIMLTAPGAPLHAAEMLLAGADDCLPKDRLTPELLRHAIETAQTIHRLREEKARLTEALWAAQKLESVGALAAGMAHDFNILLSALAGTAQVARLKSIGREVQRDLEYMLSLTERMQKQVKGMLAFKKRSCEHRAVMDVRKLLQEASTALATHVPPGVIFTLDLQDAPLSVYGEADLLQQAFFHVCVNALESMPRGGRVTIEARLVDLDPQFALSHPELSVGPHVLVQVTDSGAGIAERDLDHVFEPFYTTKRRSHDAGAGLGLAVVRQNVREHGGVVRLYSQPGHGTTVRIFLPAAQEVDTSVPLLDMLPRGDEGILLVDSNRFIRETTTAVLQRLGYQVYCAETLDECLALCDQFHNAIAGIIASADLPRCSGEMLLREIARTSPGIRVLMALGDAPEGAAEALIARGAAGVIQKPYLLKDLALRLRLALDDGPAE